MEKFNIKPGIYVVPDFGRIDCNNEVSDKDQVKLYLNPHFRVFIDATQKGIALLKKEKLTEKQIAKLINRAKNPDEVSWLLEVKSTKSLEKLAETKIKALNA